MRVIDHGKPLYDPVARRASDARYKDYKRPNEREKSRERRRRERRGHISKSHSDIALKSTSRGDHSDLVPAKPNDAEKIRTHGELVSKSPEGCGRKSYTTCERGE